MDLEDLHYFFKSEKNKRVTRIEENYVSYLKRVTPNIKANLNEKIKNYFRDVRTVQMDELFDNEMSFPLMNSSMRSVNELETILNDLVSSTTRKLEEEAEESNINANIDQTISVINKTTSFRWISGYISNYLLKLQSYFYYRYQSSLVSLNQVERLFTDLKGELNSYLINEANKIEETMKAKINEELDSLSSLYKDKIHEYRRQSNSVNSNYQSQYQDIVSLAGLKIISQGGQEYLVDSSNEYHELKENGRTADNRYAILSNRIGEYTIGDMQQNMTIISDNLTTRIINKNTNDRIKIEYGFDGYEFTINDKKIETSEEKQEFVVMLSKQYPGVYNFICRETFYGKEYIQMVEQYKENIHSKNAQAFIDEKTTAPESLLEELDEETKTRENEESLVSDLESDELSIDDEIFKLEQDPNVQRYLELMRLKEQQEENSNALEAILL